MSGAIQTVSGTGPTEKELFFPGDHADQFLLLFSFSFLFSW